MLLIRILSCWLIIGLCFSLPVISQDAQAPEADLPAFVVGVSDSAETSDRNVSGIVIGPQNLILTSSAILGRNEEVFVRFQDEAAGLPADVEAVDRDLGIALLRVAGAEDRPIARISDVDVASGEPISVIAYRGDDRFEPVAGAISAPLQFRIDGEPVRFVRHNTQAGIGNYGAGILNACNQLVAVGVHNPIWSTARAGRLSDPEGDFFALEREPLIDFLLKWGSVPPLADETCLSADQRVEQAEEQVEEVEAERNEIREELDRARQELEDAKSVAEEAKTKADEAQEEAERLERRAEELRNDADATEEQRQEAEEEASRAAEIAKQTAEDVAQADTIIAALEEQIAELEELVAQANRRLRNTIIAAVVAIVLIGGLALILLVRRGAALREATGDRERAEAELARRFADIECRGQDSDGHPHAFKISGDALLKDRDGLIVGRQPTSSAIVFNHPEVSRNHIRVRLEGERVIVEDLDSTNGTRINGEKLVPGEPRELQNGDTLSLGAILMEVTFHAA